MVILLGYETLIFKFLDLFSTNRFKFKDNDQTKDIYENIYVPICQKLFPFFRNYTESEEFVDALTYCRNVLVNSFSKINPLYIKLIDKIINKNKEFVEYEPPTMIAKVTYLTKTKNKKKKYDKKMRKYTFYQLVHEFLTDYIKMQKTLGIYKMNLNQKIRIDQITFDNINIFMLPMLIILFVLLCSCIEHIIILSVNLY